MAPEEVSHSVWKGTVSPDFRHFLDEKTPTGPQMNRQKRFLEIFRFREDIRKTTPTRCQRSRWLRRHDVGVRGSWLRWHDVGVVVERADTTVQWLRGHLRKNFKDFPQILKEQSGKKSTWV